MNVFVVLALLALLGAVVALARGIVSMTRSHEGDEPDSAVSTRMMWRRVEFQAAAVAIVLAAILLAAGL